MTPVIITLFNRPSHTNKLFESIINSKKYKKFKFYIFCDGPKSKDDNLKIKEIKKILNSYKNSLKIKCFFRKKNIGLLKNVTMSISYILKKYEKAIILEDDLIINKNFFDFMDKALTKYANHKKIFQVSGYSYPIKKKKNLHYFLSLTSCWGWGITAQNWSNFDIFLNDKKLIFYHFQKIKNSKSLKYRFNYNGSFNYFSMLEKNLNNKVNSWGIIFYLYLFINKKLTLFPNQTLVKNEGFDGSGNHKSSGNYFNQNFEFVNSGNFPKKVLNCKSSKSKIEIFFNNNLNLYGKIKNKFYEKFF